MTHDELQELLMGQVEPEGFTIWCTDNDHRTHAAFNRSSVAPELYDALSALPTLYQELTRQQKTCMHMLNTLDECILQHGKGVPVTIDLNVLHGMITSMQEGMQKAQMTAQLGVNKFSILYNNEAKSKKG